MERLSGAATSRRGGVLDRLAGRRSRRALRWTAAAGGAVLVGLLAGCSAGDSNRIASAVTAPQEDTAGGGARQAAEPAAPAPGGDTNTDSKNGSGAAPPQARIAPTRSLIRRVEITVRVDNVTTQAGQVGAIAVENEGDVYSDNRSGSAERASADIVIKIAPDRLTAALDRIAKLGAEVQRSSSTEDVTEEVADVASRVETMKASIARVRAILARATSIGDVVSVEGELGRREAELESLQARQRALDGQVASATVTVHLLAKEAPAPAATEPDEDSGFLAGLRGGWDAFAGTIGVVLTVIGAVLPFLLIVVPALIGLQVYLRRQRRPAPAAAAPAPAPGGGTPA